MEPKNWNWYILGTQKSENPFGLRNCEKVYFLTKSCLGGGDGVRFPVKGWSPKIVNGIFEKPKNQRIPFALRNCDKVYFLTKSCLDG